MTRQNSIMTKLTRSASVCTETNAQTMNNKEIGFFRDGAMTKHLLYEHRRNSRRLRMSKNLLNELLPSWHFTISPRNKQYVASVKQLSVNLTHAQQICDRQCMTMGLCACFAERREASSVLAVVKEGQLVWRERNTRVSRELTEHSQCDLEPVITCRELNATFSNTR